MNGLKDYFLGLTEEQYVTAVQAAAIAILVHYFKEDMEYNRGKEKEKQFKIEWFPNKWLGFWQTFTPKAVTTYFDKTQQKEVTLNFTVVNMLDEFIAQGIILNFKRPLKNKPTHKANVYTINPAKKDFIQDLIAKGFPNENDMEVLALEIKRYKQMNDPVPSLGLTFKSILES